MKSLQQIRENFSEPLMLDMMRKAFNAKPDSPEQKKLIAQLNAYREKYGMDPVPIGELYKYDYGSPESMRLMKKITPGQNVNEVLTVQQRKARGRLMKRLAKRIAIARKRKMRKIAGAEQLQKRAQKAAKNILRKKIAGKKGESYADLSPQQKFAIDKMVQKRAGAIPKIARKLLPKIKKAEKERIKSLRANK